MGIIKAVLGAAGGTLADQWIDTIEADDMTDQTVFVKGIAVRKNDKRSSNTKGSKDIISNGSIIQVYDNQFMMLVEGGKIVDYTAEPGYFKVDNSSQPSMFNGEFGDSLKEVFKRIKFGGVPSGSQKVFFINLQEIKGIKFGTKTPINYFDNFYNAELFLRTFGTYSIKITNPILFYAEAIPKNMEHVNINDINEQYISEFLSALQSAINKMSMEGVRISHVASKGTDLNKYMASILDEDWNKMRGMIVQSVGIESISYSEESQKLINMRNAGAMLGDANIREGYVQGSVARGIEAAGSNSAGSMQGFMGVGMGMQSTGGFMAAASSTNSEQIKRDSNKQNEWTCECGTKNMGKFCSNCGKPHENTEWICECGSKNTGKFCSNCGKPNK